jgi:hypothetical protein
MVTTGDRVRDSIADSESFTPASQGGRLRSEGVADFRRNRWPECVGIAGRFASDYARQAAGDSKGSSIFWARETTLQRL